jgi:RimJ/RimL family protein N-acetyltransferase
MGTLRHKRRCSFRDGVEAVGIESRRGMCKTLCMEEMRQSERLVLRRLRLEDAKDFVRLLAEDREAILMTAQMPDPCTEAAVREWITMRTLPATTAFAITRRGDAAFLGSIGFAGLPEMPSVGYWIGRPYRGQGYATEALQLVVGYARQIGAKGLQAETFPDNPASARVLAKCGFRDRGVIRRDHPRHGGLTHVHVHVLHFATRDGLTTREST